jgi:hypothetical protein
MSDAVVANVEYSAKENVNFTMVCSYLPLAARAP